MVSSLPKKILKSLSAKLMKCQVKMSEGVWVSYMWSFVCQLYTRKLFQSAKKMSFSTLLWLSLSFRLLAHNTNVQILSLPADRDRFFFLYGAGLCQPLPPCNTNNQDVDCLKSLFKVKYTSSCVLHAARMCVLTQQSHGPLSHNVSLW